MSDYTTENEELISRIGRLIRMLRLSMEELGLNKEIEKAAEAIPDTQDRLEYIAKMTEQAANRALTAIDNIDPMIKAVANGAESLQTSISNLSNEPTVDDYKAIIDETSQFTGLVQSHAKATHKELLEIIMAQDFQDLTGQVIKKMTGVIKEVQHQLLQVMADSSEGADEETVLMRLAQGEWEDEDEKKKLLNGPQIKPTDGDAVTGQGQVDSLLDELGL